MYICVCKAVNEGRLQEAFCRGITDPQVLQETFKIGSSCGKCVQSFQEYVKEKSLANSVAK